LPRRREKEEADRAVFRELEKFKKDNESKRSNHEKNLLGPGKIGGVCEVGVLRA